MKKIYLTLMLAMSIILVACDMDKSPYGSLEENSAIQSMNDVSRFRNGFYVNLRTITNGSYIYNQEIQMDIFHGVRGNGNRVGEFSNGLITSSTSDIESNWSSMYFIIAKANYFIKKLDELKTSDTFSETDKILLERYQGEAYFTRAFAYNWLVDHFCVPYKAAIGNDETKGLPIVTEYNPSGDVNSYPSRSTLNETYSLIEGDLEEAYKKLIAYETTDNSQVKAEANYLSSYAVLALQARIALQKGDNTTALNKAEQVINASVYSLVEIDDYEKMWTDDTGKEIIFQPFANTSELPGSIGGTFLSTTEDAADYIPTFAILAAYDAADIRGDVFFTNYTLNVENQDYPAFVFNKFPGNTALMTTNVKNFRNKSKVFRLSEMYLIAAEAAASTNAEKANKYLNDLRAKRIVGYNNETLSGTELRDAIRAERLKELIGEGFRMGDLRRWGIGFQRYATHPESANLDEAIVEAGRALNYSADDYRFTWPIPATEIDANPNLKGQQNPGY